MSNINIDILVSVRQKRQQVLTLALDQQYILHFNDVCGGIVLVHKLVNAEDSDYLLLIDIATHLAKEGKTVELLPRLHEKDIDYRKKVLPGVRVNKNPDLRIDGLYWEVEQPQYPYKNSSIDRRIRKGQEQAENLLLHFSKSVNIKTVKSLIIERFKQHRYFKKAEIWICRKRVGVFIK